MNIYLAVYLIVGAWFAGMVPPERMTGKDLVVMFLMFFLWPIGLLIGLGALAAELKAQEIER